VHTAAEIIEQAHRKAPRLGGRSSPPNRAGGRVHWPLLALLPPKDQSAEDGQREGHRGGAAVQDDEAGTE
jgi:hypothetical protein